MLEMDVTKSTAGDCPTMTELLGKIKSGKGDGCFDSAYLSRNLCIVPAKESGPPALAVHAGA